PGLIRGGRDPRPGGGQGSAALSVRDRRRHQLCEGRETRFGVRGERLADPLCVEEQNAPQPPLNDDRAGDGGADPELVPDERGDAPGNPVIVIYPDRSAGLGDRRCQTASVERPRTRYQWVLLALGGPGGQDSHRVITLVPGH